MADTTVCETRIGPAGRIARVAVGLALIGLEFLWRDPKWWDPLIGLVIVPGVLVAIAAARADRGRGELRATGPVAHLVNIAIFFVAVMAPLTSGASLLFYGASMLVAAATANGGCEVTAISNLLLRRNDQVGCAVFAPVDAAERALAGSGTPAA
jgi:hypothetical protein